MAEKRLQDGQNRTGEESLTGQPRQEISSGTAMTGHPGQDSGTGQPDR
jgi:hypothetical protein